MAKQSHKGAENNEENGSDQAKANRYTQIIEKLFFNHYQEGANEVVFERSEMEDIASKLGIKLPKNIGDVIYAICSC